MLFRIFSLHWTVRNNTGTACVPDPWTKKLSTERGKSVSSTGAESRPRRTVGSRRRLRCSLAAERGWHGIRRRQRTARSRVHRWKARYAKTASDATQHSRQPPSQYRRPGDPYLAHFGCAMHAIAKLLASEKGERFTVAVSTDKEISDASISICK
jgi:hypothetical protein